MADWQQQRAVIVDDLRGLVSGDVLADPVSLRLYATDASIFEILPLVVVRPRSLDDVSACVQYANEKGIPVHPRGAGTGLAGGALGDGIVLDLSRHMRRVLAVQDNSIRMQAGLSLERANAYLRACRMQLAIDSPTNECSTIGAILARNTIGRRFFALGPIRHYLRSLKVVLPTGQVVEIQRSLATATFSSDTLGQLGNRLSSILPQAARRETKPKRLIPVRHVPFQVDDINFGKEIDLASLFVGSEGTLGVIAEATLETFPLLPHQVVILLMFTSLKAALRAAKMAAQLEPLACDLLDQRQLSLAREDDATLEWLIPLDCRAAVMLEFQAEELSRLQQLARQADQLGSEQGAEFLGLRQAFSAAERTLLAKLTRYVQPPLYKLRGSVRPIPFVEDFAVPPASLEDFLSEMHVLLNKHEVTAAMYCHALHGQFHLRPLLDLRDQQQLNKLRDVADELYELVWRFGGSVGVAQGFGLSRTTCVKRQVGDLYPLLCKVKETLDPNGIFNPGKIVGTDGDLKHPLRDSTADSVPPDEHAGTEAGKLRRLIDLQLGWEPVELVEDARRCNGCGECRSQEPTLRMCPLYRAVPAEEASPRAKANLVRALLTGQLQPEEISSDQFKHTVDYCVHCYMCQAECPAAVKVPKLMMEAKGAYAAAHGVPNDDWVLAHVETFCRWARHFPRGFNWLLRNRFVRWLLEKTTGLAQGRKLPQLARRPFLQQAAKQKLTVPSKSRGRKVALFLDTYANYFDPFLAECLVRILTRNGIAVYVPPKQRQAGSAAISCGLLDYARRLARRNVTVLAEAVRQGYHIITPEPAAALTIKLEYPELLQDEDARMVAEKTTEACTFLWQLHQESRLQLDFRPVHTVVGYHLPCRLKALTSDSPGEQLLRLIPGLVVRRLPSGCSGMAGTFGLKASCYRLSLRAGWPLIVQLRNPDIQAGITECSACKIQMEQAAKKPTVHPIKIIAQAYGLLPPEINLFAPAKHPLVVS